MNRRLAVKNREMLTGATLQCGKLEFVGRADSQVVTNVVCFRSQPFNLGMIATGNH